ncbi:uncharacterized protein LOC124375017, partial [Homalodisca vitripennis]|uniref:uncharacterized protein LOC124375017 n=1 Tax=Homalodisca vitripennis TaxID=197043 RepID=UPI001EEAF812
MQYVRLSLKVNNSVGIFTALYVLLGGSVIQTIAAVFLLYGVYMRKSYYILEYVKLETLLHIASLIEFFLYLVLEHSTFSSQDIYIFLGFLALNYGNFVCLKYISEYFIVFGYECRKKW